MPDGKDHKSDLELIRTAVIEAGALARLVYEQGGEKVWDKSKNNPVTDADIAVDTYLRKALGEARPDYGWLSEETKDDASRLSAKRSFVVDPIDGTRAFIDRKPHFVVSVAVIENGQPIAGALYNPIKDEIFTAAIGGGAFRNGQSIHASTCSEIARCRMIGYPRKFRRLGWPDMDVSVANSMAYRIALVAAGQADAAVAFTPKCDWDLAAAVLIAREAGAVTTDITGKTLTFNTQTTVKNGVICAGPALHRLLETQVKSCGVLEKIAAYQKSLLETKMTDRNPNQLLHLVIGGELVDPMKTEFRDLKDVEFVGAFPNYAEAYAAWKSAAQRTVDNAHMRFFVLHAHELIDPDNDGIIG